MDLIDAEEFAECILSIVHNPNPSPEYKEVVLKILFDALFHDVFTGVITP